MQITFYSSFYKKKNSTKLPTIGGAGNPTDAVVVTGYLRQPCSILRPVIGLKESPSANNHPDAYRYAYIPQFARYYWVEDWMWMDGLWVVSLAVDVLASYRASIGDAEEYILRTDSTTNNFNGAISDVMYPATTNFNIEHVAFSNPFVESLSQGTYVVGIISRSSTNAVGAVSYYAMSSTQFGNLKDTLFSDDNLTIMGILDNLGNLNIDDMSKELFRTLYNPYQYIASCMWFPIQQSDISGTSQTGIDLGWWRYPNLSGKRITGQTVGLQEGVEQVPVHPQAATRGKYLNYAPYTTMTLYGKFGSVPLNTSFLEIGSYLINLYTVDIITGETIFETYVADNTAGTGRKLMNRTTFMLGTPIQIAQVGQDFLGAASQLVNTAGSAVSGSFQGFAATGTVAGAAVGAIAGGASGIYNAINAAMPQLMTSGANGSFALASISTELIVHHYQIVDEDVTHRGRPLCAIRKISTLSGYVLCAEGDLDLNAYDNERDAVREFLTTGFFWE